MKKAVAAIEKGVGGAFLQTNAAQVVKQLVEKNQDLFENDREEVMAFLEQGSEESSGEIVGILKTMIEDKKFVADLEKNCAAKQKEWDERCKLRQEELLALADTIKMLNDDDALELFKKALPSASASFVQLQVSARAMKAGALAAIRAAQHRGRP